MIGLRGRERLGLSFERLERRMRQRRPGGLVVGHHRVIEGLHKADGARQKHVTLVGLDRFLEG